MIGKRQSCMVAVKYLSENQHRIVTIFTQPKVQALFSIASLAVIVLFNSFFYIFQPYDGMGVYSEDPLGKVYYVYPNGPAAHAGVEIGDQILAIDGKQINPQVVEPRYPAGILSGETVNYLFSRNGIQITLPITIGSYFENLPLLSSYLGIQFLSIGLWIIGLLLALFSSPDDISARLLSLGFLTAGMTAAVGGASGWNSFWGASTLQKVLLCLLVPIVITAHFTFPSISFPRVKNWIICSSIATSILLIAAVMINDWYLIHHGKSLGTNTAINLRGLIFIFFMSGWLIAIFLLLYNRLISRDPERRRQTGIIFWGMVLGLGPFFVLTLLRYILFGEEYISGAYTILFLLFLPLSYSYVIFQGKLLKIDLIINRILVWFVLILLIFLASILLISVLVWLFKLPPELPLYTGIVAILIALPFTSLSKIVQQRVDRVLYGSHYDFTIVTSSMASQLAQTLDRDQLIKLMSQILPKQMGILQTSLLLVQEDSPNLRSSQLMLASSLLDDEVWGVTKPDVI